MLCRSLMQVSLGGVTVLSIPFNGVLRSTGLVPGQALPLYLAEAAVSCIALPIDWCRVASMPDEMCVMQRLTCGCCVAHRCCCYWPTAAVPIYILSFASSFASSCCSRQAIGSAAGARWGWHACPTYIRNQRRGWLQCNVRVYQQALSALLER